MREKLLSLTLPGGETIEDPTNIAGNQDLSSIVSFFVNLLFIGGALLALAFIIYGGIRWTTSGGDPEQVQRARNMIVYAVAGLVIVTLAFFVVLVLGDALGIRFFFHADNNAPPGCDPSVDPRC